MKTTVSEPRLLWCWDGTELVQMNLVQCQNEIEWWFQTPDSKEFGNTYRTYDPFYVDESRNVLIEKVGSNLVKEGNSLSTRLEVIATLLRNLHIC